eukprot:CAMPEP_0178951050 /NCGR_PEP_ID=MMETSP0789-20121207/6999_1 /TAXON_ID=3005 /ORGANISM="Rhizosolenia setigera, Strain CCMP 1694" /LENGTH=793 /DNA_ID=CAMNT_0020631857 /DNA_START=180 /DNA_END=2561 /DNA_ORIENTATION=+
MKLLQNTLQAFLASIAYSGVYGANTSLRTPLPPQTSAAHRELTDFDCTLLIKVTDWENSEDTYDVECATGDAILPFTTVPAEVQSLFDAGELQSGDDILRTSSAVISAEGELMIPAGASISIEHTYEEERMRRRRMQVSGEKKVVALRINGADVSTTSSTSKLSDEIFGTDGDLFNLRKGYEQCSYNELTMEPFIGTTSNGVSIPDGVSEVTITNTVSGANNGDIRNAAVAAGDAYLGQMNAQFNYVMLCIPPGTSGGWIAYAYINWYLSVYNDRWCEYPSGQMHELGHNIGLAHAGEGSGQYSDQSGMMGYSYSQDEGPVMCFNAAKNFQMKWFLDKTTSLTAGDINWEGNVKGLSHYGDNSVPGEVIIYIPNGGSDHYYVSYNRRYGINSGTVEGGDQVLIHRRGGSNPYEYEQSWLVKKLNAGESFSVTFGGVSTPISFESVDGESAYVKIGNGFPEDDTNSPSVVMSSAPSIALSDSPSQGNPGPSPDGPWFIDLADSPSPYVLAGVLYATYIATETTKHEVMTFAGDCATPVENVFGITSTTFSLGGSMLIDAELDIDIDAVIANEDIYTGDATSGVAVFCVEASVWSGSNKVVAHDTVYTASVSVVEGFFILQDVTLFEEMPTEIDDIDIGYEGEVDVYECDPDTLDVITPIALAAGEQLTVCVENLADTTHVDSILKMDLIQTSAQTSSGIEIVFKVIENGAVDSGNAALIDSGCDDALGICYASVVLIDAFFQSGETTYLNVEGEAILGSAKEEEEDGAFSLTVDLQSCTGSGLIGMLNRAIFGK